MCVCNGSSKNPYINIIYPSLIDFCNYSSSNTWTSTSEVRSRLSTSGLTPLMVFAPRPRYVYSKFIIIPVFFFFFFFDYFLVAFFVDVFFLSQCGSLVFITWSVLTAYLLDSFQESDESLRASGMELRWFLYRSGLR